MEKILSSVLDRLAKTVSLVDNSTDIQQRVTVLSKAFDSEFTPIVDVAMVQA